MPRMPNNMPQTTCDPRQSVVSPTIRSTEIKVKCEAPRGNTEAYIQVADIELKLKVLAESIAKDFLPLNFNRNTEITSTTPDKLTDTAYIFVDNNGKPVKILAPSVLRTEIKWEDLAESTRQKIQEKLIPGSHITIENNIISADIGVETINGKTGSVSLTASDVNAYSKNETYNKTEIADILDHLNIEIDGGCFKD